MSEKFTLELDDEAFTLASGVFPDGAVWLKVTDPLPPSCPSDAHPGGCSARHERFYATGAAGGGRASCYRRDV